MSTPVERLRSLAGLHGHRPVLINATGSGPEFRLSYAELAEAAGRGAAELAARGLAPGDRVAALLDNGIDLAVLYFVCLHGGFTIVPIPPGLSDGDVAYILQAAAPRLVITDPANAARAPDGAWRLNGAGDLLRVARPPIPFAGHPDALFAIGFTSGTSGRPKGVCHRLGAMLANVEAFNELTGLGSDTRLMHVMPMAYMAGYLNTLLSPVMAGGTVVLAPPFDAATALRFWAPARAHEVNALWLSPSMAALLTRLHRDPAVPAWTRAALRHVFVGTAPLPPTVKVAFEERFGVELLESYGMTEVMLASANTTRHPRLAGSVGRLLASVVMAARDADGRDLPAGAEGDLWINSPFALAGYLDPETSRPVPPEGDGWFPTGDIGRISPQGDLFITGRRKDLIIHGGTNVSPRAVEEVLLEHPGIGDAAVIGVPHPFWGEEVVALLELEAGTELTADMQAALLAHCRARLAKSAVPTRLQAVARFPRAVNGKVQKHRLRDGFLSGGAP